MRLLFYVFQNNKTGYGHWFRSLAMASEAIKRGHDIAIASDTIPDGLPHIPCAYNNPVDLVRALRKTQPDWLIVDLPDTLPGWIKPLATCKICVLNGIGYDQADDIDLRVIQGVRDLQLPQYIDPGKTLMGIEYFVLRDEIKQYRGWSQEREWFVWGGGNDHLGLLDRFGDICPTETSLLVVAEMTKYNGHPKCPFHVIGRPQSPNDLLEWMATSEKACMAMGMSIPEAAFLSIPSYTVSYSDLHLAFAQGMERAGLIKAWPEVGLPKTDQEFREFLETDFGFLEDNRPDGRGAERILTIMGQY